MTDTNDILAKIEELRVENEKLRAKEAKKNKPKLTLQNIPDPDPAVFLSADKVANLLVSNGVLPKAEVNDARSFLKFFSLKALAQSKAVGDKGRGKLLYMTGDVMNAISHIRNFANQGKDS